MADLTLPVTGVAAAGAAGGVSASAPVTHGQVNVSIEPQRLLLVTTVKPLHPVQILT